jgi:hypothetical protein
MKEGVGRGDRAEPGGRSPDERRDAEQLGPAVPVVEVSPQGVQHRCDQQRTAHHESHLFLVDPERIHDRFQHRVDHQHIGLVQQHEEEHHQDNEPARIEGFLHVVSFAVE